METPKLVEQDCEHNFERRRVRIRTDNPKCKDQFYFIVLWCVDCGYNRTLDMEKESYENGNS